jgi:hypothetical protein
MMAPLDSRAIPEIGYAAKSLALFARFAGPLAETEEIEKTMLSI